MPEITFQGISASVVRTDDGQETLVLSIPLDGDQGPTSTGRSTMVGKTGGWQFLDGIGLKGWKVNCNVIKK